MKRIRVTVYHRKLGPKKVWGRDVFKMFGELFAVTPSLSDTKWCVSHVQTGMMVNFTSSGSIRRSKKYAREFLKSKGPEATKAAIEKAKVQIADIKFFTEKV